MRGGDGEEERYFDRESEKRNREGATMRGSDRRHGVRERETEGWREKERITERGNPGLQGYGLIFYRWLNM